MMIIFALLMAAVIAVAITGGDQFDWQAWIPPGKEHLIDWPKNRGEWDQPKVDRMKGGDVEYFLEYFHNLGSQKRQSELFDVAIRKRKRRVGMVASRQYGKSDAVVSALEYVLLFWTNQYILLFAPTKDQGLYIIFERLCQRFKSDPILRQQVKPGNEGFLKRGEIHMRNGNILRVKTAAKDSNIRGGDPTLIVEEESQSIDDKKHDNDIMGSAGAKKGFNALDIYRAEAVLATEGEERFKVYQINVGVSTIIWQLGTPLGRNHFQNWIEEDPTVSVVKAPYYDSVIIDREHIEAERARLSEREFAAEYLCVFFDDDEYTFRREDIMRACVLDIHGRKEPKGYYERHRGAYQYYGGVDLGQRKDNSVFYVLEVHGMHRRVVFKKKYDTGLEWEEIIGDMHQHYRHWEPTVTYIDATGPTGIVYNYFVELGWDCEGFMYTNDSKRELYSNLKVMMEQGRLQLPDDDDLRKELMESREVIMPNTGMRKYPKPPGCGDDEVNALALANLAASVDSDDDSVQQTAVLSSLVESNTDFDFSPIKRKGRWEKDNHEDDIGWIDDNSSEIDSRRAHWQSDNREVTW